MSVPDSVPSLRIFDAPMAGSSLVEASAGTGKTYTITGLYVRMIAEGAWTVDRILVVTYTNAATAELRDRIRRALGEALKALRSGRHGGNPFLKDLFALDVNREICARRIEIAMLDFDLAAVYTIHGFCQRALADHAFESGAAFEPELLPDESELLLETVRDYYRREFYNAPRTFVAYARALEPESMLAWVRSFVARPYLEVRTPEVVSGEDTERSFLEAYASARDLWESSADGVVDLLLNSTALHGGRYRKVSIPGWAAELGIYFNTSVPGVRIPKSFPKFTSSVIGESLKKGQEPPVHPFFHACETLQAAAEALAVAYDSRLAHLRAGLIQYVDGAMSKRKQELGQQSFNDLLIGLQTALEDEGGETLAATLRRRFGAALIDEFQDTDPIQYGIFRRIWGGRGAPVFLVGDPKQAIYSFRGADVFAYLQGRNDARRRYTLRENWRSSPGLIDAVNALFGVVGDPFVLTGIGYSQAIAAHRQRETLADAGGDDAAFHFWFVGAREEGEPWSKAQAGGIATEATAAEIARLIEAGRRGEVRIGPRALGGGDIAILVRSHSQAAQMSAALSRLGVLSVEQSQESVYRSEEALALERLLVAIAEPAREDRVAAALTTGLLGMTGDDLFVLRQDARRWETRLSAFQDWRRRWRQSGFVRMMHHLLRTEGVARRLLARPGGARALTNLRHLIELLHVEARHRRGIDDLLQWFAERRSGEVSAGEEAQLRLESDGDLVKLVTVHKSKGLQYPIVFCPYVWDGALRNRVADTVYHDPDRELVSVLDLRGDSPAAKQAVAREELAENLRLLYVALTRAEHRCYAVWGAVRGAERSPLGWLLHPQDNGISDGAEAGAKAGPLDGNELLGRLNRLAAENPGVFHVTPVESVMQTRRVEVSADALPSLAARRFGRTLRPGPVVTSFSALTSGSDAEAPDYDSDIVYPRERAGGAGSGTIYDFPRGARAGVCLHKVFELADFTDNDPAGLNELVDRTLIAHGFDSRWGPAVVAMVRRVLDAPLDGEGRVRLSDVEPGQRLNELEFHYPIAPAHATELRRLVRAASAGDVSGSGLGSHGFMKGFVDLVFESGGRYYVVDYKSNWLGDTPGDYRRERLELAISGHDYDLQYLIYTVAVHRLLRARIPGYDYATHFGGVAYLFLRGIDPDIDPDNGVYRDRPAADLIDTLDRYFGSGQEDAIC